MCFPVLQHFDVWQEAVGALAVNPRKRKHTLQCSQLQPAGQRHPAGLHVVHKNILTCTFMLLCFPCYQSVHLCQWSLFFSCTMQSRFSFPPSPVFFFLFPGRVHFFYCGAKIVLSYCSLKHFS